jgi:hypothetical protein
MPTIGRLFYEIGGDTDRLQADLRKAVDMAKNAGLDVKRAAVPVPDGRRALFGVPDRSFVT